MARGTAETSLDKEKDLRDSISYYETALAVAPNNETNVWIKQDISFVYRSLGEYQKAIDILTKMNIHRSYNVEIADLKYNMGNTKEAKKMLQDKLWSDVFSSGWLCGALKKCYLKENNTVMGIEAQKLHISILELMIWDTPNYCDLILSWSYGDLADMYRKYNKSDDMWEALQKAAFYAVRFDGNPSYKMADIKFNDEAKGGFISNNSSSNACHSLIKKLEKHYSTFFNDQRYTDMKAELEAVAVDKKDIGLWK